MISSLPRWNQTAGHPGVESVDFHGEVDMAATTPDSDEDLAGDARRKITVRDRSFPTDPQRLHEEMKLKAREFVSKLIESAKEKRGSRPGNNNDSPT